MSYFDDASLVMIPSGYKTSKVYSVKPTDGSGDLTFTRSNDTASRIGPDGLIEKVRTNLQTYSQDFSNAVWGKSAGATLTHSQTDPNGGTTASRLQMPSGTSNYFGSSFSGATNGGKYTHSIYMKSNTGSTQSVRMIDGVRGVAGGALTASVTTSWQRFEVVITTASTNAGLQIDNAGGTYNNDILIAFAQSEVSDFGATPYIATTTAAVSVGPVANVPRLDYLNSSCPRLLLEPQRTNLSKFSEQFNNTSVWGGTATITANNAVSPDGYTNADSINPSSEAGRSLNNNSSPIAITAGTAYTISLFVKNNNFGASDYITFNTTDNVASELIGRIYPSLQTFSNTSGTGSPAWSSISTNVVNYGNGWYRYSITATAGSNSGAAVTYLTLSKNCWFYGFQFEAGAYATSYIPTLGAAVTRGTDTYQKGGFGNTSTAGTFFCEFEATKITSDNGMYLYGMGVGTTDTLGSSYATNTGSLSIIANGPTLQGRNNGYGTNLFSLTPTAGATVKIAIRYDGTNVVAFVNGVKQTVYTDNAVGVKNFIRVNNGEQSSHATKQLLFFPTALSDADAIALTA